MGDVLKQVKAALGRVWGAVIVILGARILVAVSMLFAIAFGAALLYAPDRLPTVGGLSLVQLGLPPLGLETQETQVLTEAAAAAKRQGAPARGAEVLAENADLNPILNVAGFVLSLGALVTGVWRQATLYRRRQAIV